MALFLHHLLIPWKGLSIVKVSLSLSDGQLWFHQLLPGHNMTIMWSRGLKFRSQSHACQGFQVLSPLRSHSTCSTSESAILSWKAPRTHTRSPRSPLTDFGAISSEAITLASYTTKTRSFHTSIWIGMLWLGCHVLKRLLTTFEMLVFCPL